MLEFNALLSGSLQILWSVATQNKFLPDGNGKESFLYCHHDLCFALVNLYAKKNPPVRSNHKENHPEWRQASVT